MVGYYSTKDRYYVSEKTIDRGITSLQKLEEVGQVGESNDNLVKVYRGTDFYLENAIFDEFSIILSDETRQVFVETGDINRACASSQMTHDKWLEIWGDLDTYIQAHGEFGADLNNFGLKRSMISVTKEKDIAQIFAGEDGIIIELKVPENLLIPQTLSGAGESEYLIINGFGGK